LTVRTRRAAFRRAGTASLSRTGHGDLVENRRASFRWARRLGDWSCRRSRNWCGDGRGLTSFWRTGDGNWELVRGTERTILLLWWARVNGFDDNRCLCSLVKCGRIPLMAVVHNFAGTFSAAVFTSLLVQAE
jgi:hypothetical protein